MSLHADIRGRGQRVVLAHGFTQNGRCWGPLGHDLAADHEVMAVDLPGHGLTPAELDQADLVTAGRLLGEAGGDGVYVGYSMGGRVALHLALDHPALVHGLVLIGVTAGIDEPEERASRRRADTELADRLMAQGLETFLERWLSNPLFTGLRPEAAAIPARLQNRPEGLAASLRHCGTGNQEPLWSRLDELTMPVLVLAGDRDTKFTELGKRLTAHLPQAELVLLPATHPVHLESP
ncbi:MAG: alpha/beta fold hydrolase, partial [Actinomycetia bacterium]|nr:alpha/beta fold hydrolase [Actinomycetes bacterium]